MIVGKLKKKKKKISKSHIIFNKIIQLIKNNTIIRIGNLNIVKIKFEIVAPF